MGIATKVRMTEDEFLRMPDDGRKWELVEGEPKEVPASHMHDILVARLIQLLGIHADQFGFIAASQAGFRMVNGNVRSPDVSFTRDERLPNGPADEGFGSSAPDLCIEIISPSESAGEMATKVDEYFDAGAEQVWQLFPKQKAVKVYIAPDIFTEYQADDEITGGDILPTFRCLVSELFKLRTSQRE